MTARHHQHADHARGFRWHWHDGLGAHIHHRGPDYVSYPTPGGGWVSFTGIPDEIVPAAGEVSA